MGSVFDHATDTFELDFGHEKQTFYSATVISTLKEIKCAMTLINFTLAAPVKNFSGAWTLHCSFISRKKNEVKGIPSDL